MRIKSSLKIELEGARLLFKATAGRSELKAVVLRAAFGRDDSAGLGDEDEDLTRGVGIVMI